ncbi:replication-relaxation family protein [Nocardiopsis sp. LOL_012]|uniref:replication-relaxation family protein n=1 Tax=Nocardiopsis sp. LOL_012 TaxID=3345409 RepID=UPI003A8A6FB5
MTRDNVADLLFQLSDRDRAVLESLRELRLMTTALLRRLHFIHHTEEAEEDGAKKHATEAAAAIAAMRVLGRLERRGLVARLTRRIGGVRAGSSGIVWQLGATGERLLRVIHGDPKRKRYLEPSRGFIDHTLAVAEIAVRLRELERGGVVELLALEAEPAAWRSFIAPHGARSWLKPDLFAITASGEFEDHWFIEVDRGTEHPSTVVRKAQVYERYAASGSHQAEHGLFPAVAWVVPSDDRKKALQAAFAAERRLTPERHQVVTEAEFNTLVVGDAVAQSSEIKAD